MGWRQQLSQAATNKAFQYVFGKFDKDNSGTLQPQELSSFFTDCIKHLGANFTISQDIAMKVMHSLDKNNDGKLSKQQLRGMFDHLLGNLQKYGVNTNQTNQNNQNNQNNSSQKWEMYS